MRRLQGSFTVEAAILVPFLLALCVVFVYLGIYAYDKTLMIMDVNGLAATIRDKNGVSDEEVSAICEKTFSEIKNEHPYLAAENIKMEVSSKGNTVFIQLSADWVFPLYKGYNRIICKEREVKRVSPVEKMYLTETVKKALQGVENDDSDDLRN